MAIDATPSSRTVTPASTLAQTIEAAMAVEYQAIKGAPMPAAGGEDRKILFNAIAIGLIVYLKAHEADLKLVWTGGVPSGAPQKVTLEAGP